MFNADHIFNRLIFVGGAPRSGTTFAARSLNHHPGIVTAIDDHVYECWALYYYRTRLGLVQQMRTQSRQMSQKEVKEVLQKHLFVDERFRNIAPSAKTDDYRVCSPLDRPDSVVTPGDFKWIPHSLPINRFKKDWYLCLKSPEISHVLPQLAMYFSRAKFVLVYRPVIEIAESMFRKGLTEKRFPVFHRRWEQETDEKGKWIPPPGVPEEWHELWQTGSDFQRCIIYAASYLKAEAEGIAKIPPARFFLYNHSQLRDQPVQLFAKLADFLEVDASGFNPALMELYPAEPLIEGNLKREYKKIESLLNLTDLVTRLSFLTHMAR
jgi:hypothetical protein